MIKVRSRTGESIQQMVKRFKKMCEKEGLIRDIKRNSYYESPPRGIAVADARPPVRQVHRDLYAKVFVGKVISGQGCVKNLSGICLRSIRG